MDTSATSPGRRSVPAVWAGLLITAALGWVVLVGRAPAMPTSMDGVLPALAEFLALWVVMMAAMMLPSVAPTASMYLQVVRSRSRGWRGSARAAGLVGGYFTAWTAFGLLAFGAEWLVGGLSPMDAAMPAAHTSWWAAGALAVAGLYQFTPLKARCLNHCRSPVSFLLHFGNYSGRFRDVRVGLFHGGYCVGCCWSLMLVLVAVGTMNMIWMVGLAAVVFLEKAWRYGKAFSLATGAAMLALAVLLLAFPVLDQAVLT